MGLVLGVVEGCWVGVVLGCRVGVVLGCLVGLVVGATVGVERQARVPEGCVQLVLAQPVQVTKLNG